MTDPSTYDLYRQALKDYAELAAENERLLATTVAAAFQAGLRAADLEAERDGLRAALTEIRGYLRIAGTQTHEHIGNACGVDACVVCLAEARAREALGDRGEGGTG